MRPTPALILTACLIAILSVGATAGDYHTGTELKCYQCHNIHSAKSHSYGDDADDRISSGVTTYANLLITDDVSALCLSCHDGGEAIDVYGEAGQGGQPSHRSAGRFNNTASEPYAPFTSDYGHNLGNGDETPPGGSAASDLNCTSCHDPHGNEYYRNLKDMGSGGITYATTSNDASKDVFEAKPYPAQQPADAYDASNITYNLPGAAEHHYEAFCVSCHTAIHSGGPVGGNWLSHPTVGYSRSWTPGTVSKLKTLGETDAGAGQVSCVTCHKAHGSTHPFGLIYDNRTTEEIEDSDSETNNVSITCKHCHDKGLTSSQ
ncbi:MAG: cytochrome c3 family protein [Armatimonadota bacterium]|nr:cytochrome c3 family protein [Armatimonadota bacterium]